MPILHQFPYLTPIRFLLPACMCRFLDLLHLLSKFPSLIELVEKLRIILGLEGFEVLCKLEHFIRCPLNKCVQTSVVNVQHL